MAWLLMNLRINELTHKYNDHTLEKVKLQSQLDRLASFSNAIGDGMITPSEIGSFGIDLFGDGLDFMECSNLAASQVAQEQTDYYNDTYSRITEEQYYNNPALTAQAQLYYNEDGSLNTDAMYSEFYEDALKEFAEKYMMPILNEKEKEIQTQMNELETLAAAEQAELQELKNSVRNEIQNCTVKFS